MRIFPFCCLLLGLLLACGSDNPETSANSPESAETKENAATDDWIVLFGGSETGAWRGYNRPDFPDKGWQVRDGELIVEYSGTEESGYGGDLITRDSFGSFELELEFALSDTSNSGIFYLVQEVDETPIWHHAPEYQLLDDETYRVSYPGLTDKQLTGANYDMHAQPKNYSKPIGQWNEARIVKDGDRVEHWLNDSLVVAYTLYDDDWQARYAESKFSEFPDYARAERAPIGLQDHGHLCRFRNIRIREL